MMSEYWINNERDYIEFKCFLEEENITPELIEWIDGESIYQAGEYTVHVPDEYNLEEQPEKNTYHSLIFGKDSTENITNIAFQNDLIYIYRKDDEPIVKPYKQWAVGSNWDQGCIKLKGFQYYKYMRDITQQEYQNLQENWNPRIWTPRSPEEGFMIKHGYTYYKGLKVSDVSVLGVDIEATGVDPNASDAEVLLISNTFRNQYGEITKKLFDIHDYQDQERMIIDWCIWVQKIDPDIILGHNILGYDLPYLAAQEDVILDRGKDPDVIKFREKVSKFRKDGSQQYEYHEAKIHGRDIIDTMFLSIKYDIARNFPSYGLKAIEKHLNLVGKDRIEWDFNKYPTRDYKKWPEGKWEEFRQYCIDDGDSPIKIFDIMIPAFFYLTQSVPKTLQQIINEASGSQLDSLMIRSYLQDGCSIPRTTKTKAFEGAVSMGIPGVYENVLKFDVASLYPSIMLEYNIYDKKKDPKRHMLQMLEYFRDQRLENKQLAKDTGEQYYDDLQSAQKIMINSMYGFMGANWLLYNYPDGAEEVTLRGREINLKGIEWGTGYELKKEVKRITNEGKEDEKIHYHWVLGNKVSEGKGYQLVNTDTDSFSMTNGKKPTKKEFQALLNDLNSQFSDMIVWEDDGLFEKVIVVAAKNYVLVRDGEIKYKGSSLTDQKKEPALIDFLHHMIEGLLNNYNMDRIRTIYTDYCLAALHIKNIKKWTTKKTITDKLLAGTTEPGQKCLDACNEAIDKGIISNIQEGDKVWVYQYIKGMKQKVMKGKPVFLKNGEPKMVEETALRFPELFDGEYDKWHYVKRVFMTLQILQNVLDMDQFEKYHLKSKRKLLESL